MIRINKDELIPKKFNVKNLISYKFYENDNFTDSFSELYAIYYEALMLYLDEIYNFKLLDDTLANSAYNFIQVKEEDKDIYQKLSNLKYFYLRNTLYIEKLSDEELILLRKKENLRSLIVKTFKKVITSDVETDTAYINYGLFEPKFMALNKAIVIGVRYNEEYDIEKKDPNYDDEKWDSNNNQQELVIRSIINSFNYKYRTDENSIKLIRYNQFNVIKRTNL